MAVKTVLYAQYKGPAGFESDEKDFSKLEQAGKLEVGTYYKVKKISMGSSRTYITIADINTELNSVAFEFFDVTLTDKNVPIKKQEHDIYNDKEINPYMSR